MNHLCLLGASALTGLLMPTALYAQAVEENLAVAEDAAPQGTAGVADIVVTAQRRSERLQDVPIAVSALSGDTLTQANVSGIEGLSALVPSLKISNTNGFLSTSVRGLGSTAVAPGYENPLAIYVDGVYLASQQGTFLRLANIAQVEVLKGPQGTLFGRNATAGLLQITTRDPTQDLSVNASLSYGNYDTLEGTAYISGGIGRDLAMDLSFYGLRQGEGYGDNHITGGETYQVKHSILVRSKLLWEPSDRTRVTLIGDYADSADSNVNTSALPGSINSYDLAAGPMPDLGYDSIQTTDGFKRGWNAGGSLRIEQGLGPLDLVSTTAYRKSRYIQGWDRDFTPALLEDATFTIPEQQFSQELQLQPQDSGKLKWVVGAFYFKYKGEYDPFLLNRYRGTKLRIYGRQDVESISGYAQATYEILPDTNLTLGGRYTTEERKLNGTTDVTFALTSVSLPTAVAAERKADFDKFTFRVSLDHRFSEAVLAYASFNRGFKSGGFNTGSPGTAPFEPETINAYEAGFKTNLIDNQLRFNIAGFYYSYDNVQSQRLAGGVIEIVNAAKARIYGMDFDFDARLSDRLRFTGGFGWTSAKYSSYPNGIVRNVNGGPSAFNQDLAGRYFPLAAKYTVNLALDYEVPIADGKLNLAPTLYFNSGYFTESDNVTEQKAYVQLGANVRWTDPSNRYTIALFGRNLTNKRILAYSSTTATNGVVGSVFAPPRTYGLTVGVKY